MEEEPPSSSKDADERAARSSKDLARNPRIGTVWEVNQGKVTYRLLLERTKNWIYYEVDDASKTVLIISVWGAPRGRQPTAND